MSRGLIVLASQSPRRAQLLAEAGYRFVQMQPPYTDPPAPDGDVLGSEAAARVTRLLALEKARSLLPTLERQPLDVADDEPCVLLAADTLIVDNRGRIMGQPQSRSDAHQMLERLMAGPHEVVTGVAVIDIDEPERSLSFSDVTTVYLGELLDDVIHAHLNSNQWQGKAGGYNLAELEGDWPFEVQGDRTTVIGLPMQAIRVQLEAWGVRPEIHIDPTADVREAVSE